MTDKHGKYIWHTMGDDRVRSEHAARNGQIFDYDNPPEGGNPGDAPHCRCWAEPIEENTKESLYDRHKTGAVSREFESANNPAAIGYDTKGGYSYGPYQIATNNGTFDDFMKYLKKNSNYDDYYDYLKDAGGFEAAKTKERKFELAWNRIANNERFVQAQHDFMVDKKYKPTIRLTRDIKGFNPETRHPVVREVIFSTAVQHGEGGAANIIRRALGTDASQFSDKEVIIRIYTERSNPGYFASQNTQNQHNISLRFPSEMKKVLKLSDNY